MMKTDAKKDFLPKISLFSDDQKKSCEDERDLAVVIKPVAERKGEYLAYCRSGFLDATFSVYFKDTLMGALALHSFTEMIRRRYEDEGIRILVSEEEILFKNDIHKRIQQGDICSRIDTQPFISSISQFCSTGINHYHFGTFIKGLMYT